MVACIVVNGNSQKIFLFLVLQNVRTHTIRSHTFNEFNGLNIWIHTNKNSFNVWRGQLNIHTVTDHRIQIEHFCFHMWERSLVLILRVFRVRRVYRRSMFFSLVLILRIHTYLGTTGDRFFSDLGIFFGAREIVRFLHEIECIGFVCNEFVFVLVQIDLIQFKFICFSPNWLNTIWIYSNCIKTICTKTDTNLLHTNSIHSISRKNQMISRKIGHVIQIVVHRFVPKTSVKKNLKSEKNRSPFIPRYARIRWISTKEKKIDPL